MLKLFVIFVNKLQWPFISFCNKQFLRLPQCSSLIFKHNSHFKAKTDLQEPENTAVIGSMLSTLHIHVTTFINLFIYLHCVSLNTLIQIYRSLIFLFTSYGIAAWGQAVQIDLRKILIILQKRALRLNYQ